VTFKLDKDADKWMATNPLPLPVKAVKAAPVLDGTDHYQIDMRAFKHAFHPKLPAVAVLGYNGQYPGPTIEVQSKKPVRVTWFNNLVGTNLSTLLKFGHRQGMEEDHMLTLPHNGVHLHGARVPWTSDGHPDRFYHPNEGHHAYYPNNQPVGSLWYHDHTMDVTRLNVYAGLFGLYFIRDATEAAMLPSGPQEIPLVLQDKSFTADGTQLYYTQVPGTPEFIGDYPVVNGKIWPVTTLSPRVYRLRIYNGANTRIFDLSLKRDGDTVPLPLHVIGTEGGFLDSVASVDMLSIAPGERYDVLIDLVDVPPGTTLFLHNDAPDIKGVHKHAFRQLLRIDVQGTPVADVKFRPLNVHIPPRVDPLPNALVRPSFAAIDQEIDVDVPIGLREADLTSFSAPMKLRRFVLEEYQLVMPTLPGQRSPTVLINDEDWNSAPPVAIGKDDYEVWEFQNTTPDTHPMHIHLVQFQVLSRRTIDIHEGVSSNPDRPVPKTVLGYADDSDPAVRSREDWRDPAVLGPEKGWKDTVQCYAGQATRVAMRFDGYRGDYVYHCHILEHEDMGMMYRITVD
jgi:spore coat protein A, manganese oxidase